MRADSALLTRVNIDSTASASLTRMCVATASHGCGNGGYFFKNA
jgi:hypothetical protein